MTDVFISYSRKDVEFARRLLNGLQSIGHDTWIDWESIGYSTEWWSEIQAGIVSANNFAFIISPNSLASRVCHLELAYALENGKRILPILYQPIDEQAIAVAWFGTEWEATARKNWDILKTIQWHSFNTADFDESFQQLIVALNADTAYIATHTRILTLANNWKTKNQSSNFLLKGEDLTLAQQWLANTKDKQPQPTELQRTYILASQQDRTSSQQRFTRLVLVGSFITTGVLGFILLMQWMWGGVSGNNLPQMIVIVAISAILLVNIFIALMVFRMNRKLNIPASSSSSLSDFALQIKVNEHHIFVSYSRKDSDTMQNLRSAFQAKGLKTWTDEKLTPGTPEWEREIEDAIKKAGCLTVLLSPDSNESTWVRREIGFAETFGIRIFPIMVRGDDKSSVPVRLINYQRVDARKDYDGAVKMLIAAVMEHLATKQLERQTT